MATPYIVHDPAGAAVSAVVFDTPHSGVDLPGHFRFACARQDLMFLHDPHVEKLLEDVPSAGVPVLEAMIHRTCIDLNRFEDEIDPATIEGGWPHPPRRTHHVQQNLSLFPTFAGPRSRRIAAIYNESARLTTAEAERRIRDYHRPYFAALGTLLNRAQAAHGFRIHLDVHSFNRPAGSTIDDIVLGNMNDTTCAPQLTSMVRDFFKTAGYSVGFNGVYFSGGSIVQTTGCPAQGGHSLQIEIARDLYMDQESLAFDPAKGRRVRDDLTRLAKTLDRYAATAGLSPKT